MDAQPAPGKERGAGEKAPARVRQRHNAARQLEKADEQRAGERGAEGGVQRAEQKARKDLKDDNEGADIQNACERALHRGGKGGGEGDVPAPLCRLKRFGAQGRQAAREEHPREEGRGGVDEV